MHINERDVFRFVAELSRIDWNHHNLVFLDEVSFDNQGMVRKRRYALKGKTWQFEVTSCASRECLAWASLV
jgi:hypothetical protein